MVLSSDQILEELQNIWPDYQWEFPKNPTWEPLPDDLLAEVIKECSLIDEFEEIPGIWECENYSGEWQARFRRLQYKWHKSGKYRPKTRNYISDVVGYKQDLLGRTKKHSKILIRLESGWILFEPQTNEVSRDYQSFYPFLGDS